MADVPCSFVTGIAGSGKTFLMCQRVEDNPSYGVLSASTGVAAINMGGAITVHSLLRYFDTESLYEAYQTGRLTNRLRELATGLSEKAFFDNEEFEETATNGVRSLIIDEIPMLPAEQLDTLYDATKEVNEQLEHRGLPLLGLSIVGDFAQLGPVKARWAFEAQCWPEFEANTTKLTKNWRQGDGPFIDALNLIRAGNGREGADLLKSLGARFEKFADMEFDGTTVVGKNVEVDRYNNIALRRLKGEEFTIRSWRGGKTRREWKLIPFTTTLKIGAYVMILANHYDETRELICCNGDCGHITSYDKESDTVYVKLIRTDEEVGISRIVRQHELRMLPDEFEGQEKTLAENDDSTFPHENDKGRWVMGKIRYHPLRLAYGATTHKTQGLTLDRIQVDCRGWFFGMPAMAYVALSRARTLEGLRIVGTPALLAKRVKVSEEVRRWL